MKEILTLMEHHGNLANATSIETDVVPCLGQLEIRGLVHSTQTITLKIAQGIADKLGVLEYIDETIIVIPANTVQRIHENIYGKFLKARLENNSVSIAVIKAFIGIPNAE